MRLTNIEHRKGLSICEKHHLRVLIGGVLMKKVLVKRETRQKKCIDETVTYTMSQIIQTATSSR